MVAPTFPDSTDTAPGQPVSDYGDQAKDMSFVITSLLDGQVPSAGPIDPHRIAVAGHSDGGTDVAFMALNPAYADPRIKAYVSLSSEIPAGVAGPWGTPTTGALLVAVGTDDEYGLFPNSTEVYQTADMVKAFVTVSGGDHLDTFVGATPQAQAVRDETVRFLQVTLGPGSGPVTPATLSAALEPAPDPSIAVEVGSGCAWLEVTPAAPGSSGSWASRLRRLGHGRMSMGVPGGIGASWARSLSWRRTQPCEICAPVVPISESS